jgi:transposase
MPEEEGKESKKRVRKIIPERIDHLGLVAAGIRELKIIEYFDKKLPKSSHHKVSHGQSIASMILMGLGYVNRRVYMTPQFFRGKSMERLIGEGLNPEDFNDDVIGRSLDAIYEYGATELFLELILEILPQLTQGKDQRFHADTTSISLYGDYTFESEETEEETIDITYGYSKDHRQDLKQIMLSLVTNQDGIPFYVEPLSGNASDKETLIRAIKETVKNVQKELEENQKVLYIADSALYTEKNIETLGENTPFITHVPSTLNFVKELEKAELEFQQTTDERYEEYLTTEEYGGVTQRIAVIKSKDMKERQKASFERRREKELTAAGKSLKKVCQKEYYCRADALKELERWEKNHILFRINGHEAIEKRVRTDGKRGKPNEQTPMQSLYTLRAELSFNEEEVEKRKERMGRFVLATNDMSLDGETILKIYKEQSKVEKGFRFMKDPTLRVSDVFLKSPKRIMALLMIMVLTLLVYSVLDRILLQNLKKKNEVIRNIDRKEIKRPTMLLVFGMFQSIDFATLTEDGEIVFQEITGIDERINKILSILGPEFEEIYK